MRELGTWGWALLLVLSLASCDDAPSRRESLALGLAIPSHVHAIGWIADERGEFRRAGLEVEINVTGGSAAAVRTLIAGRSDLVLAGGDAVLRARRAGADVVVVAGFVNRFYHRIVTKSSLESPADLRGKKIGLPFLGGPQDMAVSHALSMHGLAREEVEILSLGKELNALAALARGAIDATTSEAAPSELAERGLHVLIDPTEGTFPYMVLAVRGEVLASRRAAVAAALGALCAAAAFYRHGESRAVSLSILEKYLGGAAAEARFESAGPSRLSHPPLPSREAFETVGRLSGRAFSVDEWAMIDSSVIAELQARGLCRP